MDDIIIILCALSCVLSVITLILVAVSGRKKEKYDDTGLKDFISRDTSGQTENIRSLFLGFNGTLTAQTDNQKTSIEQFEKRVDALTKTVAENFSEFRAAMAESLREMRADNKEQLDRMRATVDEKLNDTLSKRFNESFKTITDSIAQMSAELGKMQNLATGVNDLKNVLTNVKTRGTWGEVSLGNILEQILTPEQYKKSCKVNPNSDEMVDYAVVLPGKESTCVYLPIDSKFPVEDYQRLSEASRNGLVAEVEEAQKAMINRVRTEAKSISKKYICTPNTTDFAVMFLPTEGLYSEVLRTPGLAESLQRDYRVVVAGPTTVAALLNSLQMGFRSVAIEKRSAEVMRLLQAFKHEFGKFNDLIAATRKKMGILMGDIDKITTRSGAIQRKLNSVESIGDTEANRILEIRDDYLPDESPYGDTENV
ncbi:MAG: DNA recombination protein RmuC [Christensenellales bacterium]